MSVILIYYIRYFFTCSRRLQKVFHSHGGIQRTSESLSFPWWNTEDFRKSFIPWWNTEDFRKSFIPWWNTEDFRKSFIPWWNTWWNKVDWKHVLTGREVVAFEVFLSSAVFLIVIPHPHPQCDSLPQYITYKFPVTVGEIGHWKYFLGSHSCSMFSGLWIGTHPLMIWPTSLVREFFRMLTLIKCAGSSWNKQLTPISCIGSSWNKLLTLINCAGLSWNKLLFY